MAGTVPELDQFSRRLGRAIKVLRARRNLNQDTLAKKSGVSSRTIGEVEDGRNCDTRTLIKILLGMAAAKTHEGLGAMWDELLREIYPGGEEHHSSVRIRS